MNRATPTMFGAYYVLSLKNPEGQEERILRSNSRRWIDTSVFRIHDPLQCTCQNTVSPTVRSKQ